jgi:hypothetical protein
MITHVASYSSIYSKTFSRIHISAAFPPGAPPPTFATAKMIVLPSGNQ